MLRGNLHYFGKLCMERLLVHKFADEDSTLLASRWTDVAEESVANEPPERCEGRPADEFRVTLSGRS